MSRLVRTMSPCLRSMLLASVFTLPVLAAPGVVLAAEPSAAPAPVVHGETAAPVSAVETALFVKEHLKTLPAKGATLVYQFRKSGAYESGYEDKVTVEVGSPDPAQDNGRPSKVEFLTGDHKTDLPPVEGAKGNPVILGFLERDVRELKRITGGQPNYYRKRLRLAMVDAKEIKPVNLRWQGHDIHGEEILLDPFKDDPARARFSRFANKTYQFILSDQVPGGVYSIKTVMHEGSLTGKVMIEETLTLTETK